MVRSSLQKKIFVQYRAFLKISWDNLPLREHIRQEYKKYAFSMPRSDFLRIEHVMRRGDKQLKLLSSEGVDAVKYVGGRNR